ncbi:MAG: D-2-hydroxyacid dehydrogenase [Defluviitaleaceae bacterium]|nr:D-2-hydroxyacid dehydrogenase [Defluviitaleaceae bacterium]
MKKLAVTFSPLTDLRLEKIKNVAEGYDVLPMKANDPQITGCEIVFGPISTALLPKADQLKWLHTQSAGVDHLFRAGVNFPPHVQLTNSAGAYGIGISEYLLTITLMLMRKKMGYAKLQFESKWQPLGKVKSIYESEICIVGLGDIGENFAKRCKALGAVVKGVVRTARLQKPQCVDELYTINDLDRAILTADVVALCLPGTNETAGLFDSDRISKMKKGALLLNIGRGSAIETDALINALKTGHLGGAGLDVTNPEPLGADSVLWQMENVIITPHVSGGESLDITGDLIVEKFVKYLKAYIAGEQFERIVDKKAGY